MEEKREESLSKLQRKRAREKRKNIEAKARHIPHDIIDNILIRLPVKSLCRFRSVCRSWNSLILNLKIETPSVLSVFESEKGQFFHCIPEEGTSTEYFPVPWENTGDKVFFSNSCNGMVLVCVSYSFYLFNPSTHYFAKVLTLNYGNILINFDEKAVVENMLIGLCYDESISDYKAVVRIHHHPRVSNDCRTMLLVSSLKGKQWNRVYSSFECGDLIRTGPVVNGRLHWLVNRKIIPFNPNSNVFEEQKSFQPPKADTKEFLNVDIGVLEGCIYVSRVLFETLPTFRVEIITMKEYGVSESWTPMFVFQNTKTKGLLFQNFNPLLITRAGKLFVKVVLKEKFPVNDLRVYDVGLNSFEKYRWRNDGKSTFTVSFVQNLDTPKGYYWDEVEHEQFGKPHDFEESRRRVEIIF